MSTTTKFVKLPDLVLWVLRVLYALTSYELAIARKYSTNKQYIDRLRNDELYWQREIFRREVNQ